MVNSVLAEEVKRPALAQQSEVQRWKGSTAVGEESHFCRLFVLVASRIWSWMVYQVYSPQKDHPLPHCQS